MGSCLSAEIKSKTETQTSPCCGIKSKTENETKTSLCCYSTCAGKGVNDMSSRSNSNLSSEESPSNSQTEGEILQSSNLKIFCYSELKQATGNFSSANMLGKGSFGRVYKGWVYEHSLMASWLGKGMAIAVKKLRKNSCQGQQEWLTEIKYLGQLYHPNIVKLIGYCSEDYHRVLVYEFMPNGSLEDHLFNRGSNSEPLSWNLRLKVALGAAKGLMFLHNKADVIFRDFKTSDILLDSNYNVKLSDLGLAKDGPVNGKTHISTGALDGHGYVAPEYIRTGHLCAKSDVYSFGVVFLEMLTGRQVVDLYRSSEEVNLVEWAMPFLTGHSRSDQYRVLDASIDGQYSYECMLQAIQLVCQCLSSEAEDRPKMGEVVEVLDELYSSEKKKTFQKS